MYLMQRPGALLGLALLAACSPGRPPSAPVAALEPPFQVQASIRELMDAEVDPAADGVWGAVSTIVTLQGERPQQPHSAEEWAAVRRSALTLIEATNLLVMDGRRIAPSNAPTVPGELAPAAAQRLLEGHREQFVGYAVALRAVAQSALRSIDARDPEQLFEIGSQLDAACESCHLVFWYPPGSGN